MRTSHEFKFKERSLELKQLILTKVKFLPYLINIDFEYSIIGGEIIDKKDRDEQPEYGDVTIKVNITSLFISNLDASKSVEMVNDEDLKEIFTIILEESPECIFN